VAVDFRVGNSARGGRERGAYRSVSCFQEKDKRGEMITINDNIK
jgi:hypothetical protein